jgi:hypothetical protein
MSDPDRRGRLLGRLMIILLGLLLLAYIAPHALRALGLL